jgi:acyl CoA:acetate/3-ketoacid CoA transferase beta subunit
VTVDFALHEVCIVACAEAWRGDGEILASPFGALPSVAARLAKATFAPELLLTDGVAALVAGVRPLDAPASTQVVEGWMPYRAVFDLVWSGRRHVMMAASQIDRFGNQNLSCIGDHARPKVQLIGMRGAPGNTINHPTSYWVPAHSPRVFVPRVDVVCGLGYDRAAALGRAGRFHEIRRVVTNLGVFDFNTPDRCMRLASCHSGVRVEDIVRATGFPLVVPERVETTRAPTAEELRLIREVLDPGGAAAKELSR